MQLIPESSSIADYLQEHEIINFSHPLVQTTLRALDMTSESEVERVQRTYEFVRDTIPHSYDVPTNHVTCKASEVLQYRTGLCYAKSHLLAALLRAQGIPAGLCYQRLADGKNTVLHGLIAVYLQQEGAWIRLDPRGNKPGIQAEFSIDEEKLAYSIQPESHEIDYPIIFTEPHPVIVRALRAHEDIEFHELRLPATL